MSGAPVGILLGLAAGLGLALAFVRLPGMRRPSLDDRLAPYLRDTARPSRLLEDVGTATPFPTLQRIIRPVLADATRFLQRSLGGDRSVRVRLDRLGGTGSVEAFRVEQLLWGGLGFLGGVAVSLALLASGQVRQPLALVVLSLLCAVAGILLRDRRLAVAVARREERMMAEFPTVAELLALSVGAGESAAAALDRVTRVCTGELARELTRALTDARAGAGLVQALDRVSRRTGLPALSRFVDGVAVAVERGTPLADVLRAQAMDVREAGRRALLDLAGRKEIAMMVPVVFLILPVTIVFALFSGIRDPVHDQFLITDEEGHMGATQSVAAALLHGHARIVRLGRDRGDVPGWVMITVMTAGIVVLLTAVAGPQLQQMFQTAIDSVTG